MLGPLVGASRFPGSAAAPYLITAALIAYSPSVSPFRFVIRSVTSWLHPVK
jgi:hypothetical protein